jgi:glycosyltransferase involved in cell wall biosynthesis
MIQLENLNWYGMFNTITGYGTVNLEFPLALQRKGIDVTLGWNRFGPENIEYKFLNEEQKALISKDYIQRDIGIIKALPPQFPYCTNSIRIGYTMVENTQVNAEWIRCCNTMNGLLVPSEFLVPVFKNSGLTIPIRAVRQGFNASNYVYFDRGERTSEKFVFGTVGFMDDRKNWQDLISAFISEFEEDEPVELWIKNTNERWGWFTLIDERIKLIGTRYTDVELNKLYQLMDCFVCPSHAEGSGLTPREAMATGLPVILTNWSGLTEIASPSISYPLTPVAIDYPDPRKDEQPGFQARIEVRELMYYMRYVYEYRKEALAKGKAASDFVHKEYNWDKCAEILISQIKELL